MLKKVFFSLLLLLFLPVLAGEYEDAFKNNYKILMYLTMPECSYCNKFDKVYEELTISYGDKVKFLKIDTTTSYGKKLAESFRIKFVPYVILIEPKKEKGLVINPDCLLQYTCTENLIKSVLE